MKPISVYDAVEGNPYTMPIYGPTVADLHVALSVLISMGYGNTHVVRADIEAGPHYVSNLELYDTASEMEQGVLLADHVFLLI